MKQFSDVSCKYGAPMGRSGSPLGEGKRSISLFRVRMVDGGYDDGGAYWGGGFGVLPLYCARCDEGGVQFVRAYSRRSAALVLGLANWRLKSPIADWAHYSLALLDGNAPMPEGVDRADVIDWAKDNGAAMGQK